MIKKTSVGVPEEFLEIIKEYNLKNPYAKINTSELCSLAIHDRLFGMGLIEE